MKDGTRLVYLENITKTYSQTAALSGVNFDLYEGEVHCLVGENGAGKSTLIKILSGAEKPDSGTIHLMSKDYAASDPGSAMKNGVATIYQEIDLVDYLTVADNIFLGNEIKKRGWMIDSASQVKKTAELMDQLKINIDPNALVETLSTAQKQNLQIVKALHRDSKVLIMDEPTSSLGSKEADALIDLTRHLASIGIGIIYISHFLEEIFKIGDRITVLKDGRKTGEFKVSDCSADTVIKAMVGRDASMFYQRHRTEIGGVLLEIDGLSGDNGVRDVSFKVRRGEIFGIGGMVGSGRTELVNLIYGADKKTAGEVRLNGHKLDIHSPKDALKNGVCMIVEDRKGIGLFMRRPVRENITISQNERNTFINLKKERDTVESLGGKISLKAESQEIDVSTLSGGNQQKTVIARTLLLDGEVYIFDEPTKGVDIGAKEEIYKLMVEIVRQGKCIIMISSGMPELLSISDRIGIMRDGKMTGEVAAPEATEEYLIRAFIGA
ncbi:MAG: sugar ABC transporter ATP-binding protein [Synergistaceae bacterium]|jgi:ribose transport system ATP-binding protein|nr:sugar ABC transporter ATP-binding protein [Synergistaceae bacterium]